jgi:hypothetical protein
VLKYVRIGFGRIGPGDGVLKEIFTSLKGALYERALSPLAGAFLLIWIIFNWKLIAVLVFGKMAILDRIKVIDQSYADPYIKYWYPLGATVVFLLLYPVLAAAAFYWSEKLFSWQRRTRKAFDLSVPLSIQESVEIKRQLEEAEKRVSSVIESRERRVKELESQNQKLTDELSALRPKATPGDVAEAQRLAEQLDAMRKENQALRDDLAARRPTPQPNLSQQAANENSWAAEVEAMRDPQRQRAIEAISEVVASMADPNLMADRDKIGYAIAKGWITRSDGGVFALTPRGEFFAQRIL